MSKRFSYKICTFYILWPFANTILTYKKPLKTYGMSDRAERALLGNNCYCAEL